MVRWYHRWVARGFLNRMLGDVIERRNEEIKELKEQIAGLKMGIEFIRLKAIEGTHKNKAFKSCCEIEDKCLDLLLSPMGREV